MMNAAVENPAVDPLPGSNREWMAPRESNFWTRQSLRTLLATADAELARTLSPDPGEFLELHRQPEGE
jgi:hypothetical protein